MKKITKSEFYKILRAMNRLEEYVATKESNVQKNDRLRKKCHYVCDLVRDVYKRQNNKMET